MYKLLPSFQQVYMNIMTIKGLNSFEYIKEDLIKSKRISTNYPIKQKFENKLENALIKKNSIIRFQNIDFNYQDSSSSGLKNINFSFKIGEKIALFGESGSGKTTLINIIAGLIKPNKGNIIIDEIVISEKNIKKFYKDVSFVPQDIHLINGSITDNIILNKQKLSLIHKKTKTNCKRLKIK